MSISIVQLLIELKGSRYIELYHQAKYIMNNKNQLTISNFVNQYSKHMPTAQTNVVVSIVISDHDEELLLSESSDRVDLSFLTALLPTSTICFTTSPTWDAVLLIISSF